MEIVVCFSEMKHKNDGGAAGDVSKGVPSETLSPVLASSSQLPDMDASCVEVLDLYAHRKGPQCMLTGTPDVRNALILLEPLEQITWKTRRQTFASHRALVVVRVGGPGGIDVFHGEAKHCCEGALFYL